MTHYIFENEILIRLGFFLGTFALMIWAEHFFKKRPNDGPLTRRRTNLTLVFIDTLLLRLLLPITAVSIAFWCQEHELGILQLVNIPLWVKMVFTLFILDFIVFSQHYIFHKIPVLWNIHKVHHTDLEFDVTTGVRFHPLEIFLSAGIKIAVIFLIGAPPAAVVLFEVALNATSLFNHSNINIPKKADRFIRKFIVTPDMHRVHHSIYKAETNSNFGFNLSMWDHLFKTYRAQPRQGHLKMKIGLENFRDSKSLGLKSLLTMPFKKY